MSTDHEKQPVMTDHEYDGITELDNNLPQWWVWLFVLSCVWALGYMVYFHVLGGPDQIEQYRQEMAAAGTPVVEEVASMASAEPTAQDAPPPAAPAYAYPDDPANDETLLAKGKAIYTQHCLVCHAPDGGGLIGPNMTDDYFIHGPTYADSIQVIIHGVPAKGMIPWQGVLKPEEIHAVASFIWTLRGSTPANPKAPEGEQATL